LSLSINVTDSAEVERQPGLREEALREIIKKRRTYPHEAVWLAEDLGAARLLMRSRPRTTSLHC
jgi:hypothetical protein